MRHLEHDLQVAAVRWFDLQYPEYSSLFFAVPNGGKRNAREAARLKAEGVRAGVSDLILLIPRNGFSSLCIELKAENGSLTQNQAEWQKQAVKYGSKSVICRELEELIKVINEYLK